MADCVFCKIVKGEIPSSKIYENERVLAFMDINPVTVGHTLVIPKAHASDLAGMSEVDVAAVAEVLRLLAPAVMRAVGARGYNILNNFGAVAGQAVEHVHFHLIPRTSGDGRGYRWLTFDYEKGRAGEIAAAIIAELGG